MKKVLIALISAFFYLSSAQAEQLEPNNPLNSLTDSLSGLSRDYQIGNEWGKKPIQEADLVRETSQFARAAKATASYGGGTAFYLGKINSRHLMGTNHHVQSSMNCRGSAHFQLLRKSFSCKVVLGHWSSIDFAIFEIAVSTEDEPLLSNVGRNFNFDKPLLSGQPLLTIGHGIASNPGRKLVANQDSDCKVFSDEVRLMGDPDQYNPGTYQAWSFANGCDVSHGDSGSAMVDRLTGEPIGIIWTGRVPKSLETQDSRTLEEWITTKNPKIWTELSYAVPASKIRETLRQFLVENPRIPQETISTIHSLIN